MHPLSRIRGTVTTGTPELSRDLTLYRSQINGKSPPRAWAETVATGATSALAQSGIRALGTYRAARVDLARTASLGSAEKQGPDWGEATLDQFVRFANYSRYFAYSFQIRFDSDCKRDTFIFRAGGSGVDSILPAQDKSGLGQYLVDAKATIALGVITLGQASATKAILDMTTCATNALAECRALLQKLNELASKVGSAPPPPAFSGSASGNGDWFFDSFTPSRKGFLSPP